MSLRFRRTFGNLFRVNLSKSGVSFSAGVPGATVNSGTVLSFTGRNRRGPIATAGIPGTGLSYRQPIGRQRRRYAAGAVGELSQNIEQVEASLRIGEAEYRAHEIKVRKVECLVEEAARRGVLEEDQAADLEIAIARLDKQRLELDQMQAELRGFKRMRSNHELGKIVKTVVIGAVMVFLWAHFAKADPLTTSRSFYDRDGHFDGSQISRGNSTSTYDARGSFAGSSTKLNDGSTSYYDRSGHFLGSSKDTTPPRGPRR
jgi:Protein of unknown function (DUF4236)